MSFLIFCLYKFLFFVSFIFVNWTIVFAGAIGGTAFLIFTILSTVYHRFYLFYLWIHLFFIWYKKIYWLAIASMYVLRIHLCEVSIKWFPNHLGRRRTYKYRWKLMWQYICVYVFYYQINYHSPINIGAN